MPDANAGDVTTIWVEVGCETSWAALPPIIIEEENVVGKFVPTIVRVSPPLILIKIVRNF